jgi:hypothetical protein
MIDRRIVRGLAAMSIAALSLLSCSKSSPTVYSGGQLYSETETLTYSSSGSILYVTNPLDIYRYCDGTNLIADTSYPETMPLSFVLSGNALTLTALDTLDSSQAVVQQNTNLARVDAGSDIQGTWRELPGTYHIVSGTPTAGELQDLDGQLASLQCQLSYMSNGVRITAAQITISTTYSAADDFIATWNGTCNEQSADSTGEAITVRKINESTVQLTGTKSGEKVTITTDAQNNISYTSSIAANTAYTYYDNPTTCPDDYAPAWFTTFVTANSSSSTLAKHPAMPGKLHAPRHVRVFGLFGK